MGKHEYLHLIEEMEKEFADAVCEADRAGLSVLEIAAITGSRKGKKIYRLLQRRGLIGNTLRKSGFRGPLMLRESLSRSCLSFTQWCNCWGFDPATAESALNSEPSLPGAARYHDAARRDFPGAYRATADLDVWEREIAADRENFSYHVEWDRKLEVYIGTVPGIPSLEVPGKYPSDILMILIRGAWLKKSIEKIRAETAITKKFFVA